MNERTPATDSARLALGTAYAMNFAALAASSPFLAIHLGASGFSPSAAAQLLALLLLVRVVAGPVWTLLADRTGSIGGVLRVVSAGALMSFALLYFESASALVATCLVAFAVFRAPFGPLLDALTLHTASDPAADFGIVRAWGTAGYALGALVTGALVARSGSRAVLSASTVTLGAALLAAGAIRGKTPAPPHHEHGGLRAIGVLVRRPRVLLLLGVALFQEMGLAPYDALFPAYLTNIGGATAAGVAIALGAGSEFVFLLTGSMLARRLRPERLLAVACAASAIRWATIAVVTSPQLLVAIQVLHSFSFGAFYMSAVLLMDRETPPALRASGQGLFGSFSFGIAAASAVSLAGIVERRGGLRMVFALASVASIAATIGALFLRPRAQEKYAAALDR